MKLFKISNLEHTRGLLTSILSSIITQFIILITSNTQVKNKDVVLYVITFVIANFLSYSLDILLAKDNFNGTRVSLYDVETRFAYLFEKVLSFQIVKFFMVVAIDFMIVNSIFKRSREFLDRKDIKFKHRDQILMGAITLFTFMLYGNLLRFEWVYVDKKNKTVDILILVWLTTLLMIQFK